MSSSIEPEVWNVPYPQNPFFTGRDDVLNQLQTALRANNTVALSHPQGISGLGGMGKTQTALEYAYRHRAEYRGVLWIRADSAAALITSFVELAQVLKLPEHNEQDQNIIVAAVQSWLSRQTKYLLIFDNMDDIEAAEPFLPRTGPGHIIFTTRARSLGGIAQRLDIQQMEPDTGALLLLRRASIIPLHTALDVAKQQERALAREISRVLDGLPLALDQAGAYIQAESCSLQNYLQLYHTRRQELLRTRGNFSEHYPASVATTWSLSFEKVKQANPASAELLNFCAFLAPDAIPEKLLTTETSHQNNAPLSMVHYPIQFDHICKEILRYSLIQRTEDTHTITIHRLVQAVIRDGMKESEQSLWIDHTTCAINATTPDADTAPLHELRTYLPHMLTCDSFIKEGNIQSNETIKLLRDIIVYSHHIGDFHSSINFANKALKILPDDAGLYLWRGMAFKSCKDYERAFDDMNHALRLDPDSIWMRVHRALAYIENNDYQHALGDINTALTFDPNNAWLYIHRSLFHIGNNNYKEAFGDMNHAIHLDPAYSGAYVHRARFYGRINDYQQASDDINTAVSLDPNSAWVRTHSALISIESKDYENALNKMNMAVSLDPTNAWVYVHRARLYSRINDYQHAFDDINTAITLHPNNAWIYFHQALIYKNINNYPQALQNFNRALELDPNNTEYLIHQAMMYRANGEYQSALHELDLILSNNTTNMQAYIERALTYKLSNNHQKALQDLNRASRISPENAKVYAERSDVYLLMGYTEQAKEDIDHCRFLDLINTYNDDGKEPWI
jgi:tetratricopeptide (TPR) repeat protein